MKSLLFFNCLCFIMVSFGGQKRLGPRQDWSPLEVQFKISDEHPPLSYESPPGLQRQAFYAFFAFRIR